MLLVIRMWHAVTWSLGCSRRGLVIAQACVKPLVHGLRNISTLTRQNSKAWHLLPALSAHRWQRGVVPRTSQFSVRTSPHLFFHQHGRALSLSPWASCQVHVILPLIS